MARTHPLHGRSTHVPRTRLSPPVIRPRSIHPYLDLVETHKEGVYYLALDLTGNHHDAEDLAQEVFIKAYRALDSFRGEAKVFTWLYRITVNTHLNRRHKKAVRYMQLREDFDRTADASGALPDTGTDTERPRCSLTSKRRWMCFPQASDRPSSSNI